VLSCPVVHLMFYVVHLVCYAVHLVCPVLSVYSVNPLCTSTICTQCYHHGYLIRSMGALACLHASSLLFLATIPRRHGSSPHILVYTHRRLHASSLPLTLVDTFVDITVATLVDTLVRSSTPSLTSPLTPPSTQCNGMRWGISVYSAVSLYKLLGIGIES